MPCKSLPPYYPTYPQFHNVTGRTMGSWHRSWWEIGNIFANERLFPTPVNGVLGVVIHPYIFSEFPTFYDKAFMAWKGNMGFSSVVDDGHSTTAIYPITGAWITSFLANRFYWARDADMQPNDCITCRQYPDCYPVMMDGV